MGISIGLVGLGSFGSAFAELFKHHPDVDRVALCDREPERIDKFAKMPSFADKFDPSDAYASLDDMCKANLDAWFRDGAHGSLQDVLSRDRIRRRGWFEPEEVRTLIDRHRHGEIKASNRLYALFYLELWAERYL